MARISPLSYEHMDPQQLLVRDRQVVEHGLHVLGLGGDVDACILATSAKTAQASD